MKIYDNALPEDKFKILQDAILTPDFPWYWGGTAYMSKMDVSIFGNTFAHNALHQGKYLSNIAPLVEEAAILLVESTGKKIKTLDRVRIAMTTATAESYQHPPHIDMVIPHEVGILYLNDSDGDTYFYNERYDLSKGPDTYQQYMEIKDNLTLESKASPKANRFVTFDGMKWHNSSTPTKVARRVIINYNYTTR